MKNKRIFNNVHKEARIIIGEKPWKILKHEIDEEIQTKLEIVARRAFILGIIVGWILIALCVSVWHLLR